MELNITYETRIHVALEGEKIGEIRRDGTGYRYYPDAAKSKPGKWFDSIGAVKKSIEGPQ
jgi:hypothetical protein